MSDLLNKASLVMIPSGYKEDVVYSAIPTDGSGDLSFTRASNGTRINSAGLVEDCPWNLLQYSEDFSNGVWAQQSNVVTSNSTTAPNGTTTADTISNTNTTALFRTYQGSITGYGTPQTLTFSSYFKYKDHRYISFGITDDLVYRSQVVIDLQNMVITENFKHNSADTLTSTIESVGNGWYKVVGVFTYVTNLAGGNAYLLYKFQTSGTFDGVGTYQTGTGFYIWGAQLNIGSTAKPYFPTTDRLNVPRLTYQNGGGGCPSLLLEKQSTNLSLYSQDFTNGAYLQSVPSGTLTITANYSTSPDGTQNADRLQYSGGSQYTQLYQLLTHSTNVVSIYVKSNTSSSQTFRLWGNDFAQVSSNLTATTTWQRFDFAVTGSGTKGVGFCTDSSGNALDISIWGFQFEPSSYPTSYIPTTSSSATRVADACFKTGISSLIGQTEGVLFVDILWTNYDNSPKWIAFLGASSAYIGLYADDSNHFVAEVFNSTSQFTNGSYTFSIGQRYKLALAYKANDFAFYVNGTQVATDSSGTVPTTSSFDFNYNTTNDRLGGKLYNEIILSKTRLTNAELQSLTTL